MRTFNEQLTNEADTNIRKKLAEVVESSLSFKLHEFMLGGTSRADVDKYVVRTEEDITYGFIFSLTLGKPAEVAKWILEIDSLMTKLFGKGTARNERVIGSKSYVDFGLETTDSNTKKHLIDGRDTRVQIPVVEYWYDPEVVESADIYKNLATLHKFNI